MSVNELNLPLPARENSFFGNRPLGILAMVGAPMLLLFFIFGNADASAAKTSEERLICLAGVLYIGGWICGATGMRRLKATGNGLGAKIVFIIQITLLSFALVFSAMEVGGYNFRNGGLIFSIADLGYPFSHLFMNVVAVLVLRAKIWKGLPKFAPFIVGIALPITLALMALGNANFAAILFGTMTGTGLGIIGWAVYRES